MPFQRPAVEEFLVLPEVDGHDHGSKLDVHHSHGQDGVLRPQRVDPPVPPLQLVCVAGVGVEWEGKPAPLLDEDVELCWRHVLVVGVAPVQDATPPPLDLPLELDRVADERLLPLADPPVALLLDFDHPGLEVDDHHVLRIAHPHERAWVVLDHVLRSLIAVVDYRVHAHVDVHSVIQGPLSPPPEGMLQDVAVLLEPRAPTRILGAVHAGSPALGRVEDVTLVLVVGAVVLRALEHVLARVLEAAAVHVVVARVRLALAACAIPIGDLTVSHPLALRLAAEPAHVDDPPPGIHTGVQDSDLAPPEPDDQLVGPVGKDHRVASVLVHVRRADRAHVLSVHHPALDHLIGGVVEVRAWIRRAIELLGRVVSIVAERGVIALPIG
mmetsp:Transcript_5305/g.11782  ORF Transcript_5305/g.11782 Transcript_5305/m.11782 type:complete len:383 (-) Transcript_5305:439-1587(-)